MAGLCHIVRIDSDTVQLVDEDNRFIVLMRSYLHDYDPFIEEQILIQGEGGYVHLDEGELRQYQW